MIRARAEIVNEVKSSIDVWHMLTTSQTWSDHSPLATINEVKVYGNEPIPTALRQYLSVDRYFISDSPVGERTGEWVPDYGVIVAERELNNKYLIACNGFVPLAYEPTHPEPLVKSWIFIRLVLQQMEYNCSVYNRRRHGGIYSSGTDGYGKRYVIGTHQDDQILAEISEKCSKKGYLYREKERMFHILQNGGYDSYFYVWLKDNIYLASDWDGRVEKYTKGHYTPLTRTTARTHDSFEDIVEDIKKVRDAGSGNFDHNGTIWQITHDSIYTTLHTTNINVASQYPCVGDIISFKGARPDFSIGSSSMQAQVGSTKLRLIQVRNEILDRVYAVNITIDGQIVRARGLSGVCFSDSSNQFTITSVGIGDDGCTTLCDRNNANVLATAMQVWHINDQLKNTSKILRLMPFGDCFALTLMVEGRTVIALLNNSHPKHFSWAIDPALAGPLVFFEEVWARPYYSRHICVAETEDEITGDVLVDEEVRTYRITFVRGRDCISVSEAWVPCIPGKPTCLIGGYIGGVLTDYTILREERWCGTTNLFLSNNILRMPKNSSSVIAQPVIVSLKEHQLIEADMSQEEFFYLILQSSNKSWSVMKWIVSQFSEAYQKDLEKADDVKIELAHKLCELQYLKTSDVQRFIDGKLSAGELEVLYNKIFKAYKYLTISRQTQDVTSNEIKETIEACIRTNNMVRLHIHVPDKNQKPYKSFNLNEAKKTLEKAIHLLDGKSLLDGEVQTSVGEEPELPVPEQASPLSMDDLEELSKRSTSIQQHLSKLLPSSSLSTTPWESASTDLGEAVTKLHNTLQIVTEVTKETPEALEVAKKIDTRKLLEDINKFKENSIILNSSSKTS